MKPQHVLTRPLYKLYEEQVQRSLDRARLPRHIGVILDGHRRFPREEGLPDYASSYRAGVDKLIEFLGWCASLEIPAVTCWLLSTDNLRRSDDELQPVFTAFLDLFDRLPDVANQHGFSVGFIGSLDMLPAQLHRAAKELEEKCSTGKHRITIALAYGGRQEIVDAARDLVARLVSEGVPPERLASDIDASSLAGHLYTADLPDPDLVLRTSGESRLSGFLLWQAAYAEYSFIDVVWPAFRRVDFLRALRSYTQRERRFGR